MSLLPVNKWSDSFGDLESIELHMPRTQIGEVEASLTDEGYMAHELGTAGYQLLGCIFSDLAVLDIRQEAGHACEAINGMQSWMLGDFNLRHHPNNKAFKSEIYDDACLMDLKHKRAMCIRQWDPGIPRSATSGIHNNSSSDLLNGWSPYLPQSDEVKTLLVFMAEEHGMLFITRSSFFIEWIRIVSFQEEASD